MIEINGDFYAKDTIKLIGKVLYDGKKGYYYFIVITYLGHDKYDDIVKVIIKEEDGLSKISKLRNELIAKLSQ